MDGQALALNHEKEIKARSGWGMLVGVIVVFAAGIALLIAAAVLGDDRGGNDGAVVALVVVGILLLVLGSILSPGFFTLEPNETRVCVLFG
ncbi:MAG: hypothetical protein JW990_07800, partial [Thermoleophilia bacterium]|nr:hypothetical protein [Thermoleophilia bacterium]